MAGTVTTTGWIVLGVANIPVYFVLGFVMFKDWSDFGDCIRFWLTPDVISLFRGEYQDDLWQSMKLGLWLVACVGCVYGEAHLISTRHFLPAIFG